MKKLLAMLFTGMIAFSLVMPVFAQDTTQETTKMAKTKKTKATKTKKAKKEKTTSSAPAQ